MTSTVARIGHAQVVTTRIKRRLNERARRAVPPPPASPTRSFTRDVLINVLANLLAAGVIYLLAVAAGYITADGAMVVVALILTIAVGVAFFDTTLGIPMDRHGKRMPISLWLAELALYLAGLAYMVFLFVKNAF